MLDKALGYGWLATWLLASCRGPPSGVLCPVLFYTTLHNTILRTRSQYRLEAMLTRMCVAWNISRGLLICSHNILSSLRFASFRRRRRHGHEISSLPLPPSPPPPGAWSYKLRADGVGSSCLRSPRSPPALRDPSTRSWRYTRPRACAYSA